MSSKNSSIQKQLESKQNLLKLIDLICTQYKLDFNLETNIINIKSFLGPIRGDIIAARATNIDEANLIVVKLYGESIKSNQYTLPDDINKTTKFLTKLIQTPGDDASNASTAYKSSFSNRKEREGFKDAPAILDMNMPDRIETIKFLNYQSLFRDEYIYIDSRYQNKVNSDPSKILFSLIAGTKTKSDHGGIIIGSSIKDIVEIEVYPFSLPYKPVYATFYNKITLSVNEWVASSFEAYEGGQFHFCFDIDKIDNNLIYLKPVNQTYTFSKPVNHIDNFSLSFGAVFPKIVFDSDRMYPSNIDYSNELGLFSFSEKHGLVTGDLVYITEFNTPEPAQDVNLITEVNRSEGHVIVKKDNYSILINVDLRGIRREESPNSGRFPIDDFTQRALVYFASKRVQIQMRLRYLTSYA